MFVLYFTDMSFFWACRVHIFKFSRQPWGFRKLLSIKKNKKGRNWIFSLNCMVPEVGASAETQRYKPPKVGMDQLTNNFSKLYWRSCRLMTNQLLRRLVRFNTNSTTNPLLSSKCQFSRHNKGKPAEQLLFTKLFNKIQLVSLTFWGKHFKTSLQ